eukprot:scaffold129363_cov63-Phaeocystis_antarctica.AAC.3
MTKRASSLGSDQSAPLRVKLIVCSPKHATGFYLLTYLLTTAHLDLEHDSCGRLAAEVGHGAHDPRVGGLMSGVREQLCCRGVNIGAKLEGAHSSGYGAKVIYADECVARESHGAPCLARHVRRRRVEQRR